MYVPFCSREDENKEKKNVEQGDGEYGNWKHARSYELDSLESIHRIKMTNARTMQRRIGKPLPLSQSSTMTDR